MALKPPPARTEISDTSPNPNNGTARTGFGKLWDFVTSLLGLTGATTDMLAASKILDPATRFNLSLVPTLAGNALTMTVKSRDGATSYAVDNAGSFSQRNATAATGTHNVRNITADIATTISSGSTAGHTSGVYGCIHWYLIDNAGALELAWSTTSYGDSGIVSTTAEGGAGAADSAGVMYSTTARTNVPYRMIGRTHDVQAAAGTWVTAPFLVELAPFEFETFRGQISGLIWSNDPGDTIHDIAVAPGVTPDLYHNLMLRLVAPITKRLDAAWAVGSGNGGLDTGALAVSTDYYGYLIKRMDTGVLDCLWSASAVAPTMPANYFVRSNPIAYCSTDGAGSITQFHVYETAGGGSIVNWDTNTSDVSLPNTLTTSRRLDVVRVPKSFPVIARLRIRVADSTTAGQAIICDPNEADIAPSAGGAPLATHFWVTAAADFRETTVRTNSSGQIAARSTVATNDTYIIITVGFEWSRQF